MQKTMIKVVSCLLIITGIILKGFFGGCLVGSCSTLIVLVTIGDYYLKKSVDTIQKIINQKQTT